MTWEDFKDLVYQGIRNNAERFGTETYRNFILRQAVIDVQRNVPFFRGGHETTFGVDDLDVVQSASRGRLPEECQPKEAYFVATGHACSRTSIFSYQWPNRYDLIAGSMLPDQRAIAIDPKGNEFYVWPKVTEGYQVVLVWDGQKLDFDDDDEVPFTEAMALCVSYFVQSHFELEVNKDLETSRHFMNPTTKTGLYFSARRGLYLDTIARQRVMDDQPSPQKATAQSMDAIPVDDDTEIEFVLLGESGKTATLANTSAVASLVKSLEPDFILHIGNTNFPAGDPVTISANLLAYYDGYIGQDTWWQCFGPIDQDTDLGVALLALMPNVSEISGEDLFYTFTKGPVAFFVLDSGATGDDDFIATSGQDTWLEEQLAASEADWNVVIVTKPPYSSDEDLKPGVTETRLSYADWGADLVISAGASNYERLIEYGLQYVVCGLGGASKTDFDDDPVEGSQVRYNSKYGCLRITASATRMQVTFMDVNRVVIDRFALNQ